MKKQIKKIIALAITLFITQSVLADDLKTPVTLANEGDMIVLSDVTGTEVTVFLSYTGKQFNHCGLSIRPNHLFHKNHLDTALILTDGMDVALSEGKSLVLPIANPEMTSHGQFFMIKSKVPGKSLVDSVRGLDDSFLANAIVEILTCESL